MKGLIGITTVRFALLRYEVLSKYNI